MQNIRGRIGCLFQLSADVAELDLVASLAQVSTLQMYVRPTFGPKLELLESRHPVMEVFGLDGPVPNDVVNVLLFSFFLLAILVFDHRFIFIVERFDTLQLFCNLWAEHERQIDLS